MEIVVNQEVQYSTSNFSMEPAQPLPGAAVMIRFELVESNLLRAHLSDTRPTLITYDNKGESGRFVKCTEVSESRGQGRNFSFKGTYMPRELLY